MVQTLEILELAENIPKISMSGRCVEPLSTTLLIARHVPGSGPTVVGKTLCGIYNPDRIQLYECIDGQTLHQSQTVHVVDVMKPQCHHDVSPQPLEQICHHFVLTCYCD